TLPATIPPLSTTVTVQRPLVTPTVPPSPPDLSPSVVSLTVKQSSSLLSTVNSQLSPPSLSRHSSSWPSPVESSKMLTAISTVSSNSAPQSLTRLLDSLNVSPSEISILSGLTAQVVPSLNLT